MQDAILIPAEAIEYIEKIESLEKAPLAKYEVIEYFFEWLKKQPLGSQIDILKGILDGE